MEFITQAFVGIMMIFASLTGTGEVGASPAQTVEIGLAEVSPNGTSGGFAIPASGCSPADPDWHGYPIHDCDTLPDIWVDKEIIRYGDFVEVSWDPRTHQNCVLSSNVTSLQPPGADGTIPDSRDDTPTGETIYTITCDGDGNTDSATVKVLPRIQET